MRGIAEEEGDLSEVCGIICIKEVANYFLQLMEYMYI